MSHPDEPLPSPSAPAETAPTPIDGGSIESPVPSGAPYRVPAPPVEPPEPALPWAPAPRRPRPIIGATLSVFAVLLWTFVVAGQFTTSWLVGAPLGQGAAVTLVLLTTFVAWIASVRRSTLALPPRSTAHFVGRALGISVLTPLLFFVCVVAAAAAGGVSSQNHDVLIAFALVVVSTLAAIAGPRLTSPARPERTHRQRVALVMLWLTGALLTLIAGADLAANG